MATSLGNAHGEIVLDAAPARKGTEEAAKHARALEGVIIGVSASITSAFIDAGAAIGRALAGIAVDGVKMAADLEEQMSGVQAVMGITADEVERLEELILDLGIDPKLKVSTLEAAEAIEMLGRNGLTTKDILDGAARSTVLLANATGAEFGLAADIATDTMALFNIEASNMERAVDGITSVVTNSKFTIQDYGAALAAGGGVASQVGVNLDDFNASVVAVSAAFGSGSDAGTSFKTMLMRLASPTRESLTEMQNLGLATEDGSIAFFDANGNMREMAEIAGLLNGAISGLSDQQRSNALSTIFGAYGMRFAAQMANYTEEEFRELQATMADTSAAEAAAIRMDNFRGAMEILSGIVETIKIRIGQALLPVLTRLARAMSEFLEQNADKFVAFFERAASLIDAVVDAVMDGQSPLAAFMQVLAEHGVNTSVLDPLWQFVDVLKALVQYFRFVVEDGDALNDWLTHLPGAIRPIVRVLGEFIALIMENGDAVKDLLFGIGSGLATFLVINRVVGGITAFIGIVSKLAAGVAAVGGPISAIVAALGGPLTLAIAGVALVAGGFAVAWKNNWGDIQGKTQAVVDAVKPMLSDLGSNLKALFTGDEINFDNFGKALENIGIPPEVAARIRDGLVDVFLNIGDFLDEIDLFGTWESAIEAIKDAAGGVFDFLLEQGGKVAEWFQENKGRIVEVGAAIAGAVGILAGLLAKVFGVLVREGAKAWTFIEPLLGGFVDLFLGIVQTILQIATGDWAGAWETIKEVGSKVWDAVKEAAGAFVDWVAGWFGSTGAEIKETWKGIWENVKTAARLAWERIKEAVANGIQAVKDAIANRASEMWEGLKSDWQAIKDWVSDLWEGIKEGVAAVWEGLKQSVSDGVTSTRDALVSAWEGLKDWVAGIWEGIKESVRSALISLLDAMGLDGEAMLARWAAIWEDIKLIVGTVWDRISGVVSEKVEAVRSAIADKLTVVKDWMSSTWDAISGKVSEVWEKVRGAVAEKVEAVRSAISEKITSAKEAAAAAWDETSSKASDIWDAIKGAVEEKVEAVRSAIEEKVEAAKETAGDIWDEISSKVSEIWDAIKGVVEEKVEEVKTTIGDGISDAKDAIGEKVSDFMSAGGDLIQGLIDGVLSMAGDLISAVTGGVENALSAAKALLGITSPSRVFYWIGEMIVQGLVDALHDGADAVEDAMGALFGLTSHFMGVGAAAAAAYRRLVEPRLQAEIEQLEDVLSAEQENLALLLAQRDAMTVWDDRMLQDVHLEALAAGNLALARQVEAVWQTQENMAAGASELAQALGWNRTWVDDQDKLIAAYRKAQESGDRNTERMISAFLDMQESHRRARATLAASIGVGEDDVTDPETLARRYAEAQLAGDTQVLRQIEAVIAAQEERNQAEKAYADELERINQLQEAQANLQFLQQQLDMLNMLAEHGLSAREVLGDIHLGAGADPLAIVEAMTATLDAVAGRVNQEIGSLMGYALPLSGPDDLTGAMMQAAGFGGKATAGQSIVIYGGLHLDNVSDPQSLFEQLAALGVTPSAL